MPVHENSDGGQERASPAPKFALVVQRIECELAEFVIEACPPLFLLMLP